jgi:hypothetical protein
MEMCIFRLLLVVDGATEKVSQFVRPIKSVYDKKCGFNEQKCIFENCRKVKTKNFIITLLKFFLICSLNLFSGTIYSLVHILHRDVLFLWPVP